MTADARLIHPVMARIGKAVHARHLSHADLVPLMGGGWGAGAIGGWLRGTRHPTLGAVGQLAAVVGLEIGTYPAGTDVAGLLARVVELEAENAALRGYVARHAIAVDEPLLRSVA